MNVFTAVAGEVALSSGVPAPGGAPGGDAAAVAGEAAQAWDVPAVAGRAAPEDPRDRRGAFNRILETILAGMQAPFGLAGVESPAAAFGPTAAAVVPPPETDLGAEAPSRGIIGRIGAVADAATRSPVPGGGNAAAEARTPVTMAGGGAAPPGRALEPPAGPDGRAGDGPALAAVTAHPRRAAADGHAGGAPGMMTHPTVGVARERAGGAVAVAAGLAGGAVAVAAGLAGGAVAVAAELAERTGAVAAGDARRAAPVVTAGGGPASEPAGPGGGIVPAAEKAVTAAAPETLPPAAPAGAAADAALGQGGIAPAAADAPAQALGGVADAPAQPVGGGADAPAKAGAGANAPAMLVAVPGGAPAKRMSRAGDAVTAGREEAAGSADARAAAAAAASPDDDTAGRFAGTPGAGIGHALPGIGHPAAGREAQSPGATADATTTVTVPGTADDGVTMAELFPRLVRALTWEASGGRRRVTLHLVPEHLGRVQVDMVLRGSDLRAAFTVDRPDVALAIQQQLGDLGSVLRQHGLEVAQLAVALAGGGAGDGSTGPRRRAEEIPDGLPARSHGAARRVGTIGATAARASPAWVPGMPVLDLLA